MSIEGAEHHIYDINDRGEIPYRVHVYPERNLMGFSDSCSLKTNLDNMRLCYSNLMMGENGNTMLMDMGPGYYFYVGERIFSFCLFDDIITSYISPIRDHISYPLALGTHYIYFFNINPGNKFDGVRRMPRRLFEHILDNVPAQYNLYYEQETRYFHNEENEIENVNIGRVVPRLCN